MDKNLYFRTQAVLADDDGTNDSLCVPYSSFRLAQPLADQTLALYFNAMTESGTVGMDLTRVELTIAANKHKEVLEAITNAVAFSKDQFVVVGDDITSDYLANDITAVGTIDVVAAS